MNFSMFFAVSFLEYTGVILPQLLEGALQTIRIFALTLVLAVPLGLLVYFGSATKFLPLKIFTRAYIWVFRGTPLMLQLFFVYFFLPYIGITLSAFQSAIFAFAANYAAYFAEIYRSGIESVDPGQTEAARALGLSKAKTMRYIILPQTFRRIIPPFSNEVITLVKDTALVNVISVSELLRAAKSAVNRDTNPTAYLITAIIYLILTFALTMFSGWLEKKASYYEPKQEDPHKKRRPEFLSRLGS